MTDFNLPVPDDAPFLNLSQEEIEQLRQQKKELTEYGREKLKKLATKALDKLYDENGAALQQLAEIERKEFYRFFAVEYYGTGDGISYWLKICRNYPPYDGEDLDLEYFKNFINDSYHSQCIEEPTEEEFMSRYSNLIPAHIVKMVEHNNQPEFIWETHFHVNYS